MNRIQLPANVVPAHYDLFIRPDAGRLSFQGSVRVSLEVREATRTVVLNAVELAIERAVLAGQAEDTASIVLDAEGQTAR